MSWSEIESELDRDFYRLALVEGDEQNETHTKESNSSRDAQTQEDLVDIEKRIETMRGWFGERDSESTTPSKATKATGATDPTDAIASKMDSISSMRAYVGGNLSPIDIARAEIGGMRVEDIQADSADIAAIEVAEMADYSLPEVQQYIAQLMHSIHP